MSTEPDLSMIHEGLRSLAMPISKLKHDPKNARKHSDRNINAISDSLQAHGQRKPLVAQKKGRDIIVRAGNGTMDAALALGWTHLAVVVVKEDDKDAVAYAIRDNRTAELAEWDDMILGEQLQFLDSFEESVHVGFEVGQKARYINALFDEPVAPEGFQELDDDIKTEYRCPQCKYEWSGKAK